MLRVKVELRRRLWGCEDLGTVEVPHEASDCHDQVVGLLKGHVLMPGDTVTLRPPEAGALALVAVPGLHGSRTHAILGEDEDFDHEAWARLVD